MRGAAGLPQSVQKERLRAFGCRKLYSDRQEWPPDFSQRDAAIKHLKSGDTLVVCHLAELALSVPDLLAVIDRITARKACLVSLEEAVELPGDAAFLDALHHLRAFLNHGYREKAQVRRSRSQPDKPVRQAFRLDAKGKRWLVARLKRADYDEEIAAAHFGISLPTLRRVIHREGLKPPPHDNGKTGYGYRVDLSEQDRDWIKGELLEGKTPVTHIAERLGVSYITLRRLLHRYDLAQYADIKPGRPWGKDTLTDQEIVWLRQSLINEVPLGTICKTLGVTNRGLHRLMDRYDLTSLCTARRGRPPEAEKPRHRTHRSLARESGKNDRL